MKVEIKTFENVWGCAVFNAELHRKMKHHHLVVGVDTLFSSKYKPVKGKTTIVIDNFARLRSSGVPIIGYEKSPTQTWVKVKASWKKPKPNKPEIKKPVYLAGELKVLLPTVPLMLEYQAAVTLEQMEALAEKYRAEIDKPKKGSHKWLRRSVNSTLKVLAPEKYDPKFKEKAAAAPKSKLGAKAKKAKDVNTEVAKRKGKK
ncbi:hypothetical protein [Achromobacter phage Motura]|uniref:Uncharacterized protein n=1 Tax=Achromobacter phage Motura TaxID=2591403 RepID=A0A514CSI9_9CAUD|nr:hypothetical protein H1O15_gp027 [Achromobacter phage Motura]QDH83435.1 hypothetical protein [Achromobacter phage Motura]